MEEVTASIRCPETLMYMAAAARQIGTDLRHEGWQDAMPVCDLLNAGFKKHGPVGRLQSIGIKDRRLIYSRPGLGMQAFRRAIDKVAAKIATEEAVKIDVPTPVTKSDSKQN